MAARIRTHEWSSTSLGTIEQWPQYLKTAVELMLSSPGPVSILWGSERIQLYNDAYVPIAGERHPKALGRPAAENWPEAFADFLRPAFDRVFAGETVTVNETAIPLRKPDGTTQERYFTGSFQPVRDDAGNVAGIFHPLGEVTARVTADAELQESEARYRALFETIESGFCVVEVDLDAFGGRIDYRVVEANPAFFRQTGFPEAILGCWLREAAPQLEEHWYETYGRVARTGEPARFEQGSDMLGRWFDVYAFRTGKPEARRVAILFTDITTRRSAEFALQESEARFRNMADQAPVMMWVTDPDGRCIYLNRSWYEFTGQSAAEGEGFGWLDAVHPDDRGWSGDMFVAANAKQAPFRLEYRLRRADGTYRWAIDAASPRLGPDGEFLGYIGSVIDIDQRREVEDALRVSEERLRLAVDNAEIGFWDVDVINDVLIWPPRTKAMFGISADVPVTMQDFYDGLHPEDREATSRAYSAAADPAVRLLYDVEYRTVGKEDGRIRWVAAKGRGVFDGPGAAARCLRVIGTVIDITARKAVEERLRELNETLERRVAEALAERKLLADIVEGTDAFVQVVDAEFRWLAINRAAADEFDRIFGVRPVVGQSMLEVLGDQPEHRDAVRAVWSRALAGESFTEIGEFGDPGRDRRFYEMKYNVLRDAEGELIGAYQFVYDVTQRITEQRQLAEAEAARREADALYRAYFENTAEALFVVNVLDDGGFTVEDLNPAHQASIGLPLDEVKGKRLDDILPPEVAATVIDHYRRVIAEGGVYQYRETFELNGRTSHWDTVLVPVRDADGKIVRLIGSSRDLTAQLVAEEQLRQSQKLEAMGQLTGGVAHDFNNLLTPIIGSLDMLMRKGIGSERERRLIDGALQSGERARMLVQRLLAFARRQPLQPMAVDLRTVVEGMAGLMASTLGPAIDVRVDLGPDLPPVTADPNQLEMALLNLAVNARDAMPEGGALTIAAKRRNVGRQHEAKLDRGDYVVLSVADTGVGMDEATRARAVEPFFSTKGIGKGTGLGLSMVHGLVAQLGGGLTIDSAPGQGTSIELWLPISADPVKVLEGAAAPAEDHRSRGTALLVDDEELVRMSTAEMLIDLGFDVVEAGSAEDAWHAVETGAKPDIVITDHLMPGMSGAELARKLRETRPDLPVLIVSGYAEADGVTPDLPRLTKPFRNSELAAKLDELTPA
ncbi:MAG TPA: PAS domain S-box protein [Sphingomonas sp.]|nr:PAS domain S-box protein [Sphingomonas sp.]